MLQGLIPALQQVLHGAPHRFCAMHLWKNFTKQWKSKELKGVVWDCAKSTTVPEFNQNLARVKALNIKAWEYLKKWPKEAWTKAWTMLHISFLSNQPMEHNIGHLLHNLAQYCTTQNTHVQSCTKIRIQKIPLTLLYLLVVMDKHNTVSHYSLSSLLFEW